MRNITIITGASSGLGKEFTIQLYKELSKADEKQEMWLFARSQTNLEQVKNEALAIETKNSAGVELKLFSKDLSGRQGAEDFNTILQAEFSASPLKIINLINNAGFGTYGPFTETSVQREMEMIDLNCTSLTGICGFAIPFISKGSRIINVASLAAFQPLGNFAVYAASKAYVLNFTVALAAELKDSGIKVSALCPGSVSTNFANVASNGKRKEVLGGRDPVKVVSHCLKKSAKGKTIILTFAKWKFTAFLSRFIGRFFTARFTFKHAKRPH